MMQQVTVTKGGSWLKWSLLPLFPLLLLYAILLVPLFACIYLHSEYSRRRRAWRLRAAMQIAGRTSTWADVEADLLSGVGTIIVDEPCLGWSDADIWWTRESVQSAAANDGITLPRGGLGKLDQTEFQARIDAPDVDRWCQARYFDPSNGVATLVQCTHWHRDEQKIRIRIDQLRESFPGLETADTYTWMVQMAAEMAGPGSSPDER